MLAPPPVLTWLTSSTFPYFLQAVAVSPPPKQKINKCFGNSKHRQKDYNTLSATPEQFKDTWACYFEVNCLQK